MKIWVAEYILTPTSSPNAASASTPRNGFLLKIEWSPGVTGYSDVFPWPEFGDPTSEELKESLRQKATPFHPLLVNSSIYNREDARARAAGQSLFLGQQIPESHSLGVQREAGFKVFKIKMSDDKMPDLDLKDGEKLRLDFNGCLTISEFLNFWKNLDSEIRSKIDLVEDPWREKSTALTAQLIAETVDAKIPLASDFYSDSHWLHVVVKPARISWESLKPRGRMIITHSMDHPVGQAFALWCASLSDFRRQNAPENKNEIHGVSPSKNYVPNDFHHFWSEYTPRPRPPKGTGIGFDDLLASQKWVPL